MDFQDKSIQCHDCSTTFVFGVEEQELFHSKGHQNAPKRCPQCRQTRKERIGSNANINGTGGYGYQTRRQLFPAVCADCGKATEVPFEPSQGRPVYCSDCYRKVRVSR